MANTLYSHAFLVGSFNGELNTQCIEKDSRWKRMTLTTEEYSDLYSMYYKSHIDAIADMPLDVVRPARLQCIRHYQSDVAKSVWFCQQIVREMSIEIKPLTKYLLNICSIHIYVFPFNTVLFSIEIDESGSELNEMTSAHWLLMTWNWEQFSPLTKKQFESLLQPLADYLPKKDVTKLVKQGNKLKLFQVHQVDVNPFDDMDALLYEIATSSPIGTVHKNCPSTPSHSYYEKMMTEYAVSVFNNWKALAIVDTFTVISSDAKFNRWTFENLYFPIIYLRCMFEKSFCFSRNNNYRQGKDCINLLEEITEMEKYYFYDNISFNFLPNLLYQAIAKGLSIKEEREELSKQIKESRKEDIRKEKEKEEKKKEAESKRKDRILAGVAIFAVISVMWDFCSIFKDAIGISESNRSPIPAIAFIILGGILIGLLMFLIFHKRNEEE